MPTRHVATALAVGLLLAVPSDAAAGARAPSAQTQVKQRFAALTDYARGLPASAVSRSNKAAVLRRIAAARRLASGDPCRSLQALQRGKFNAFLVVEALPRVTPTPTGGSARGQLLSHVLNTQAALMGTPKARALWRLPRQPGQRGDRDAAREQRARRAHEALAADADVRVTPRRARRLPADRHGGNGRDGRRRQARTTGHHALPGRAAGGEHRRPRRPDARLCHGRRQPDAAPARARRPGADPGDDRRAGCARPLVVPRGPVREIEPCVPVQPRAPAYRQCQAARQHAQPARRRRRRRRRPLQGAQQGAPGAHVRRRDRPLRRRQQGHVRERPQAQVGLGDSLPELVRDGARQLERDRLEPGPGRPDARVLRRGDARRHLPRPREAGDPVRERSQRGGLRDQGGAGRRRARTDRLDARRDPGLHPRGAERRLRDDPLVRRAVRRHVTRADLERPVHRRRRRGGVRHRVGPPLLAQRPRGRVRRRAARAASRRTTSTPPTPS